MSENEKQELVEVPFYIHEAVCDKLERTHEAALDKMDKSNKRLLAALITVCITLIITVCCFLAAYRTMNNNWMKFFDTHTIEEVQDGSLYGEEAPGTD